MSRVHWSFPIVLALCSSGLAQEAEKRFQIPLKSGTITPAPIARPPSSAAPGGAAPSFSPTPPSPAAAAESTAVASPLNRFILQFNEIPSAAQIEQLRNKGTTLHEYVGGNSYYATIAQPSTISAQDESIRAVVPLTAKEKIHPDVMKDQLPASAAGRKTVTIQVFRDVNLDTLAAQVQALNGSVVETSKASASAVVVIDKNRIEDLARLNGVKIIEPAPPPKQRLNDDMRRNMGADLVAGPPYTLDGAGVKVGVWDGGAVDASHDDFKGRITVIDTHVATDHHATHVAGTVGGSGARSKSVDEELQLVQTLPLSGHEAPAGSVSSASEQTASTPLVPTAAGTDRQWHGVAPGVHIFSHFWDRPTDAHEAAIKTHGVQVSQNSWSYTVSEAFGTCNLYGEYTNEAGAYDDIITGLFGTRIPIVFAAGNERNDGDCGLSGVPPFSNYGTIPPPATAKNIIAVGAIHSDNDQVTEFTSWGPTKDGRLKPDIVAAGCQSGSDRTVTSTVPGNRYGGMCGTSMAAPAVSGAIALLIQQQAKLAGSNSLLPSSLKAALVHTATDLHTEGPDFRTGYGKVAAKPAADIVRDRKITESQIVTTKQIQNAPLAVKTGTAELKVTLVWDDARGATSSSVTLVNDLDLQLVSPSGAIHQPWLLDPKDPDRPATTGVDHRNVLEQVVVKNPEVGNWVIQVRGFAVPKPPQRFSLAVTTR